MRPSTAEYYDQNTPRFLKHMPGNEAHAIHRALWAPGVTNRIESLYYVNSLILEDLPETKSATVLDLGCGVGSSIIYLSSRANGRFTGITNSSVQQRIAQDNLAAQPPGIQERCRVRHGDFMDETLYRSILGTETVDLAFMIESFVHGPDAEGLFNLLAGFSRPGARLVICDDILQQRREAEPRILKEYREGWHVSSLYTVGELTAIAERAGYHLQTNVDLTRYIELDRPRDVLIRAAVAAGRWFPFRGAFWENMLGGNAIQQCLKKGVIAYRYLVFQKRQPVALKPPS